MTDTPSPPSGRAATDERAVLLDVILEEMREIRRDLGEVRAGSRGMLATTREMRATVAEMTAICDRLDAKLDAITEHRRGA